MSVKLYREIQKYINSQKEVLRSFENETNYSDNWEIQKLLNNLYYNINFLKENVERIVND